MDLWDVLALIDLLCCDGFILTDMDELELEVERLQKENDVLKNNYQNLRSSKKERKNHE